MLNFSPEKMFFIFLIVMIVLGPDKLPEISRKIGKAMGELRKLSGGFRDEMNKAVREVTSESPEPSSKDTSAGGSATEVAPGATGSSENDGVSGS